MYKLVANEIETLSTHKIYSNMNIIQREREWVYVASLCSQVNLLLFYYINISQSFKLKYFKLKQHIYWTKTQMKA